MKNIVVLIVILGCISYPITTILFLHNNVNTAIGNIYIKGIFAVIYVVAFVYGVSKNARVVPRAMPIIIFFILYAFRLIIDIELLHVRVNGYSGTYILLYYFVLTVLPSIAIIFNMDMINVRSIDKFLYWSLVVANILLVYHAYGDGINNLDSLLITRMQVEGEVEGTAILNPICYGVMGSAVSILALVRLSLMRDLHFAKIIGYMVVIIVGNVNLIMGASRGPFISFIMSVGLLIIYFFKSSCSIGLNIQKVNWYYLLMPLMLLIILFYTDYFPSYLASRMLSLYDDRSMGMAEERDFLYDSAWKDFVESPILGKSFVSSYMSIYPHNIPLEVLMSIGVLGGMVFLLVIIILLQSINRVFRGHLGIHSVSITLAGICFIFLGMTSGSIHSYPEFWIFLSLITCIGEIKLAEDKNGKLRGMINVISIR